MSMVYLPLCLDCANKTKIGSAKQRTCCKAFPDGIPPEVWASKTAKTKEEPCGKGYKFEPKKK